MKGIGPKVNQGDRIPGQNDNQGKQPPKSGRLGARKVTHHDAQPQLPKTRGGHLRTFLKKALKSLRVVAHKPDRYFSKKPKQKVTAQPETSPLLYDNATVRLAISKVRITERFEIPGEHVRDFINKADSIQATSGLQGGIKQSQKNKAPASSRFDRVLLNHKNNLNIAINAPRKEQHGRIIIDNLESGMKVVEQHLSEGLLNPDEQARFTMMLGQLDAERALVLQVMDDPGFTEVSGKFDWQTCIELKRTGYSMNAAILQHFSNLNDDQVVEGSEVFYGKGFLHTVTKLTYDTKQEQVELIFKAEDAFDGSDFDQVAGADNYFDKSRPKFVARNLAGLKIQKMLGLDLMPPMQMAMHDGKIGMLMGVAKGVQPHDANNNTVPDLPYDSPDQPEVSANIQKNLTGAEWLDGICGQQDRHMGNYFIDSGSGKVTLIDSDLAFYPGLHNVREKSHSQARPGGWSGSRAGLPALIDAKLHSNLMNLNESDLYHELNGLLEPKEIDATISRIDQLKQHAHKLAENGRVVENWQTWSQSPPPVRVVDVLRDQSDEDGYFSTVDYFKSWAAKTGRLVSVSA